MFDKLCHLFRHQNSKQYLNEDFITTQLYRETIINSIELLADSDQYISCKGYNMTVSVQFTLLAMKFILVQKRNKYQYESICNQAYCLLTTTRI